MLRKLRFKLSIYFAALVLILYEIGVFGALAVFKYNLDRSMDLLLADLLSEIRPSVQIVASAPSLQNWADTARHEHSPILATAQVFDNKGNLAQSFGPPGIANLVSGQSRSKDGKHVRSMFQPIIHNNKQHGYLQVQVSTVQVEKNMNEMLLATVFVLPFLALGVALAGFSFSGIALRPLERVLILWRRFIADAGHELKTPVSVIQAGMETLRHVHKEHGLSELELDLVLHASQRMKVLINDLLTLAKVEEPGQIYQLETFCLNLLLDSVLEELRNQAGEKKIELSVEAEPEIFIKARKELLHQLLSNLVSNAICYSNPAGKVKINLSRTNKQVIIQVQDNGIGISASDQAHIFERFYRVEASRSRDAGGAGLGLSIVKAVVEAHKGSISVSSKSGEGSCFTVLLPQADA